MKLKFCPDIICPPWKSDVMTYDICQEKNGTFNIFGFVHNNFITMQN